MGSSCSILRHSTSSLLPPNHDGRCREEETAAPRARSSSILEQLFPGCLKTRRNKKEDEKEEMEETKPTLEEWLLFSPSLDPQPCKQIPKIRSLTSLFVYEHLDLTPRESFTMDDEEGKHGHGKGLDSSFNSTGQVKRRVTFRLPEEGDIHIISS